MTNQLYAFWGASAGLSGWLLYKMWKERQRYVEVSEKIAQYGVLSVSELKALGPKISQYQLDNFNPVTVGNEHPVMVKGEFHSEKPYLSSKANMKLVYHVSLLP